MAFASSYNRNPAGNNQHGIVLKADNEVLIHALEKYHRELLSSNKKIAARLAADHGIIMSEATVKRRRKELGLLGSGKMTKQLPEQVKEQLVLNQMDQDPARRAGIISTQHRIAHSTGTHLTREFVSSVMHLHDPEGFVLRDPTSKRILRVPKVPIGIHERWAGDGHDKLYKIGFPVWAVVNDATTAWIGAWIVPSNRMGAIIGYLFLCLVEKFGGIPLQFSTDCGSETTQLFGLVNTLRSKYHGDIDLEDLPAHVYLRSVHNISIERSWLRLRLDWGDNAVLKFNEGIDMGYYNPSNAKQYQLCQWLWPKLLRRTLSEFMDFRNGVRMRKDKDKAGPSGMSWNEAFSLPESWGGRNCLLPIDIDIVRQLKDEIGGEELLEFVSSDFSEQASKAYDTLGIQKLTLENIWSVFRELLPIVFPEANSQ